MEWKEIATLVQNVGVSVVILMFLGVAIWRILLYTRTVIERLLARHVDFIDTIEQAVLKRLDTVVERLEVVADDTAKVRSVIVRTEQVVIEHSRKP